MLQSSFPAAIREFLDSGLPAQIWVGSSCISFDLIKSLVCNKALRAFIFACFGHTIFRLKASEPASCLRLLGDP